MKILLIEDDEEISRFIRDNLREDVFLVDTAKDGAGGAYMAKANQYDVIVMDYSLPIKDGLAICEELRDADITTPIIFLTRYSETKRKVMALDKGADDYMTKPFALEELKARIFALARRPKKMEGNLLRVDDLTLDTRKKVVSRGNTSIYLTRKTYDLLEYFMKNQGMIISRGMIMEYVWNGESDPFSNTIESHIANLRRKININGKRNILKNIPGRGYVIGV